MNKDTVDNLLRVMNNTTKSLANLLSDAYGEIEQLENKSDVMLLENTELKKQIQHLQASLDAECGCEGTTYDEEEM